MNKQQLQESLPWYVNDTLTDAEKQEVETALAEHPELHQEVAFLQTLQSAVKQQQPGSQPPGEMGLQRLKREIIKETPSSTSSSASRWRVFAVAASLLAVIQAGYILQQSTTDTGIVPLSGSHYEGPVLQIQFKDNASEQAIRALLFKHQARMIDGPSASGVYRIAVKSSGKPIAETVKELQTNHNLVDYVAEE